MKGQEGFFTRLTKSLQLPEDLVQGRGSCQCQREELPYCGKFQENFLLYSGEIKLITKKGFLSISGKESENRLLYKG